MRWSLALCATTLLACPGKPDEPQPRTQRSSANAALPARRTAARTRPVPKPHAQTKIYALNGFRIAVGLVPEKRIFMVGEPIYLTFEIHNRSARPLQTYWGGDYRNRLGRPERYRVRVRRLDQQKPLPLISAGPGFGGLGGSWHIDAGAKKTRELFLPNWATITTPGKYELTCTRTFHLDPITPKKLGASRGQKGVTTIARAVVTVTKADPVRLGKLIKELAEILLGKHHDSATKAGRALAAIRDPRVILHFVKAYKAKGYSRRMLAIRVLGSFATNEALAGLKLCMRDPNAVLRHSCAASLSVCKHPKAHALLLSMRTDPAQAVRLTVLHALGKMKCAKSKALMRKMTRDKDKVVRSEAKRYLKECRNKRRPDPLTR